MRSFLSCMLFVLLGLPVLAQSSTSRALVIFHKNGTQTRVELNTQPCVMFVANKVSVSSDKLILEFPADEVLRFIYEDTEVPTPTEQVPQESVSVKQTEGQLLFRGVTSKDKITLYTIGGLRIPTAISFNKGGAVLPLSNLPSGVYLLNINGKTSKIVKK